MSEPNRASDIATLCAGHRDREAPLLPILHAVQAQRGFIGNDAVSEVAHALNLTRAEVYGVVRFYEDFRNQPPRRHTLRVCRAEACQAQGGRAVWAAARAMASDPDYELDVEAVYCLGNCPCGPSVQLDGRALGRVGPTRVRELINQVREDSA